MTDFKPSIALVTPLKDEIDNIEKFFSNISSQSIPIKMFNNS